MKSRLKSTSALVVCNSRVLRLIAMFGIVASLCSVAASAPATAEEILASTFSFTTINGTATKNHPGVSGLPISATTIFGKSLLDAPISDPDDPVGTARHELFHGIGFTDAYNFFFAHIYTPTSGPLIGVPVFNQLTNTLGNDLLVMTANLGHDVAGNFNGLGNGGTLLNQTFFLMTPGPFPGAPVPYAIDQRDVDALNAAFNWSGIGGIKINVVFDNSQGTWTAAEKARINQARDDVQAKFGPANGTNAFTWTVQVFDAAAVPEPSTLALTSIGALALLIHGVRRRSVC